MKNNERNKKIATILTIFTIIFTIMGGSLAYWTWESNTKTNVAFSIGANFSCSADGGENINANDVMLAPTAKCNDSKYAIERKVTITPKINQNDLSISMDLWLNVNSIGSNLSQSENFKYAITSIQGNCDKNAEGYINGGNFKNLGSGDTANLFSQKKYTGINIVPEEYWLYIWLASEETNNDIQGENFNFSLGGVCTDKKDDTLSNHIMSLANKNGSGVYHETGSVTIEPIYAEIPSNKSEWTSVTSNSEVEIIESDDRWSLVCVDLTYSEDYGWDICDNSTAIANFYPKKAGYYNINLSSVNSSSISIDGNTIGWCSQIDCEIELGYLTEENIITIEENLNIEEGYLDFSANFQFFYMPGVSETMNYDAGYRYQGETVDNYITFNDETWRIIGVEEGSTIGLESGKYYTKIIRDDLITSGDGTSAFCSVYLDPMDGSSGANLISSLSYYYESTEWDTLFGAYYDYTDIGIKEDWRDKIAYAKWYEISYSQFGSVQYPIEKKFGTQYKKYVNLMSPSDYEFSIYTNENRQCGSYNEAPPCNTWLNKGNEWILNESYFSEEMGENLGIALFLNGEDNEFNKTGMQPYYIGNCLPFRPTLYLNSDVQLTDGSGKIGDQYKIS